MLDVFLCTVQVPVQEPVQVPVHLIRGVGAGMSSNEMTGSMDLQPVSCSAHGPPPARGLPVACQLAPPARLHWLWPFQRAARVQLVCSRLHKPGDLHRCSPTLHGASQFLPGAVAWRCFPSHSQSLPVPPSPSRSKGVAPSRDRVRGWARRKRQERLARG